MGIAKDLTKMSYLAKAVIVFAFPFLCILLSCNKPAPVEIKPDPKPKLELTVADTTCISAWVKLSLGTEATRPAGVKLQFASAKPLELQLHGSDTTIRFDSLLPARNYALTAWLASDSGNVHSKLTLRTMDTTSHAFSNWQVWEFGDGISNILYDVAILDDTTIWAVGYYYITEGNKLQDYNAVEQGNNGIKYFNVRSGGATPGHLGSIESIFAFNKNDVWLGNYTHWNSEEFTKISKNIDFPTILYGIWGKNWQDVYVVGVSGLMAHYNGSGWEKLPQLTDMFLGDVYGNATTGEVYAVGLNSSENKGIVLQKKDGQWGVNISGYSSSAVNPDELFKTQLYGSFSSVWVDQKGQVYVAGGLGYMLSHGKWSFLQGLSIKFNGIYPQRDGWEYIYSLRGQYSNDICIAGELNTLQHFNGYSWKQIGLPFNLPEYSWRKVEMRGNMVVVVGYKGSKAVIMKLMR